MQTLGDKCFELDQISQDAASNALLAGTKESIAIVA
jgi:hypothetical protein